MSSPSNLRAARSHRGPIVIDTDVFGADLIPWLPAAGWRFVEHLPLAGAQSLTLAEAV